MFGDAAFSLPLLPCELRGTVSTCRADFALPCEAHAPDLF